MWKLKKKIDKNDTKEININAKESNDKKET